MRSTRRKKGLTQRDLKAARYSGDESGIALPDFSLAKLNSAGPAVKPPDAGTLTMALTGKNEIVDT
jgi:hypothetical protein